MLHQDIGFLSDDLVLENQFIAVVHLKNYIEKQFFSQIFLVSMVVPNFYFYPNPLSKKICKK